MGELRTNDHFWGGNIALYILGDLLRFFGGDTNDEYSVRTLVVSVIILLSKYAIIDSGTSRDFEGCLPIDAFLNGLLNYIAAALRSPTSSFLSFLQTQLETFL